MSIASKYQGIFIIQKFQRLIVINYNHSITYY